MVVFTTLPDSSTVTRASIVISPGGKLDALKPGGGGSGVTAWSTETGESGCAHAGPADELAAGTGDVDGAGVWQRTGDAVAVQTKSDVAMRKSFLKPGFRN